MDTVLVACQDTFISHVFSWELANLGFAPHICLPCWTSLEGYQRHVLLMTMSETEVKKKDLVKPGLRTVSVSSASFW